MESRSREQEAADLTLGTLPEAEVQAARESVARDSEAQQLLTEMQETADALRTWQRRVEAERPGVLPLRKPARRLWPVGIAAAAAFGVTIGIVTLAHRRERPDLAAELTWIQQPREATVTSPAREVTVHYKVRPRSESPRRIAGSSTSDGSGERRYEPRALDARRQMDNFVRQVAFSFHVPESLSGGLCLLYAEREGSDRVRLFYSGNGQDLTVFLAKSSGPDMPPRGLTVGGRTLVAGRRHAVVVAFEGGAQENGDWNSVMRHFVNGERAGENPDDGSNG